MIVSTNSEYLLDENEILSGAITTMLEIEEFFYFLFYETGL